MNVHFGGEHALRSLSRETSSLFTFLLIQNIIVSKSRWLWRNIWQESFYFNLLRISGMCQSNISGAKPGLEVRSKIQRKYTKNGTFLLQ